MKALSNTQLSAMDVAAQDAALLSSVEVGLGALLHAFRVPLTGQFLSLHQILLLSRSAIQLRSIRGGRTIAFQISFVAALLKSLAPAGKKLTPMLAIAMQGLLLSLGTLFLGVNVVGLLLGATLSALWAFVQPALLYLLIFGLPLIEASQRVLEKFSTDLGFSPHAWQLIVILCVGGKVLLAWTAVVLAYWLPETALARWQRKLLQLKYKTIAAQAQPSGAPIWWLALQDLRNPLFVLSFAVTVGFFLFAESPRAQLIWAVLRPIAIGYVFFFLLRWLPTSAKLPRWFSQYTKPLERAVEQMHRLDR